MIKRLIRVLRRFFGLSEKTTPTITNIRTGDTDERVWAARRIT